MVEKKAPRKLPASKAAPKRQLGLEQQTLQRTSAREWLLSRQGEEVEVPSGNVALLRRPGPEMFFQGGMVPDALSGIVDSAVREKKGLKPEQVKDLGDDPSMFPAMLMMIDSAVCAAAVEPKVRPNPTCVAPMPGSPDVLCDEPAGASIHGKKDAKGHHNFIEGDRIEPDDREPMFLYASEVDFNDKVFIFQYAAGGSRDLERFREEYGQLMDSVSTVPDGPE